MWLHSAFGVILVLLCAACVAWAEPEAPPLDDAVDSIELARVEVEETRDSFVPYGVAMPAYIWRFGTFNAGAIEVCWERAAMPFAQERGWVRTAIESSWQRHSGLTFTGWAQCPNAQTAGIRVTVVDSEELPRVRRFGRALAGHPAGIELNFSFARAQAYHRTQPKGWPFEDCTLPVNRQSCIQATAIHEFGHAIALAHEQMHPDTPASCPRDPRDGRQIEITARYDPMSVMNYCRPDRMRALSLSDMDVRTVQALYCRPGIRDCGGYRLNTIID